MGQGHDSLAPKNPHYFQSIGETFLALWVLNLLKTEVSDILVSIIVHTDTIEIKLEKESYEHKLFIKIFRVGFLLGDLEDAEE